MLHSFKSEFRNHIFEAVLTEAADLRKYITGISTSFGYVLSDKNGSVFYTDTRYLEGAGKALKESDTRALSAIEQALFIRFNS